MDRDVRRKLTLLPIASAALRSLYRGPQYKPPRFLSSSSYWKERYQRGIGSGHGSRGHLAEFKAAALNLFVKENGVTSVVEFGCGDGAQLKLADYTQYTGIDVSPQAI